MGHVDRFLTNKKHNSERNVTLHKRVLILHAVHVNLTVSFQKETEF